MSVNSAPLGATQSGAFELRAPALEARTTARLSPVGLLGLAGMLATGLLLSISAASTDRLLPQTLQAGIRTTGLAGSFGNTGINLGSAGLTVTVGLMFVSYVVVVGAARRLSPVLVLGCIAALNALILLGPPLASTDIFSYQFYGRMGGLYGIANPYLRRSPRDRARSSLPVHRLEVVRHPHGLRTGVHGAQLRARAAVDPRQRVRLQGDRRPVEPRDRGAGVERRPSARRRSRQGGSARRPEPADRAVRRSAEATTTS